jgi:hypothetical protein
MSNVRAIIDMIVDEYLTIRNVLEVLKEGRGKIKYNITYLLKIYK